MATAVIHWERAVLVWSLLVWSVVFLIMIVLDATGVLDRFHLWQSGYYEIKQRISELPKIP